VASLCGALGAMAAVYMLASAPRRPTSTAVLLLAGVSLNAFISALIVFVQYVSDYTQTFRVMRWLVGDLDVGGFGPVWAAAALLVVVFALAAPLASTLNVLTLGEQLAATRGVNVAASQRLAFFTASLATSTAVSLAGPVAFIGIVVPHLVRLMVGVDHRGVLPAAALFGASFLIACDLIARTIIAPVELPVGIVTAVIGGPFFLWLLVRKR
jgi:iron complex transport system permease protein